MLCQECQQKTANVHLTQMINGQKIELHLCETCAAKHSAFGINLGFPIQFSIHHLLSGLMQETASPKPEQGEKADPLTCPFCGMTLSLIHISEPTRLGMISYAVFCLKKK